jgi:hAT family C-terminal dimerisation region
MSSESEDDTTQIQEAITEKAEAQIKVNHWTNVMKKVGKGKSMGKTVNHFLCNYCPKDFQGPSSGTILKHLRKIHPKRCPELLATKGQISSRGFFDKAKMKEPFNDDIFMGKLLKWIVKTDQPFSVVDNLHFEDLLEYLKKDLGVKSRRTIMRRLEELYNQKKNEMKERLNGFNSKFSVTCDVWTSKNQLSFFGFTIHYIDDDWQMKEELLAFKFLEGEHDGKSLSVAFIDVLEDFGIADRLLGVTADNASNNSTMMAHMEAYYKERYPDAGFSVAWNQVECMAHVLNLGAQQILKEFKQPVEKDTYEAGSDSSDDMVTAVSRLSFLCRKIRLAPKLRRLLEIVCNEKEVKYSVPIIDVVTRWNSTYDMLVRAVEIKDAMSDTFYRHKDRDLINLVLTEADWNCISQLIEVLAPLKEATLLASQNGESLMVTSMIPIYDYCTEMLKESLKIFDENDDIYIGIESAIVKLNHYYDKISPMVGIALILDPTLKKDFLKKSLGWQVEWVDSVMDQFTSSFHFYREKSKASASIASAASVSTGPSPLGFGNYLKKRRTADGDADGVEEFVRYFNAPLAEVGTNALSFWKTNQFHYPILSAMAKDYLTVQASSVASERAFSSGTDLVTADRCSLGGDTIEMTQFLKYVL